jgi:hypothetical protein
MGLEYDSGYDIEFDPKEIAWMKTHTVGDMKALANEVEEHGEDASELIEFYANLRGIEIDYAEFIKTRYAAFVPA